MIWSVFFYISLNLYVFSLNVCCNLMITWAFMITAGFFARLVLNLLEAQSFSVLHWILIHSDSPINTWQLKTFTFYGHYSVVFACMWETLHNLCNIFNMELCRYNATLTSCYLNETSCSKYLKSLFKIYYFNYIY